MKKQTKKAVEDLEKVFVKKWQEGEKKNEKDNDDDING